jgi:hypothetical protein
MGEGGSCCEDGLISPDDLSDHLQLADEPVAMSAFSTSSLLTRDFQKSAAYQEYILAKGDVEGHIFHGNQYAAGGGDGKTAQVSSNSQAAPKTDAERLGNVPGASKALLTQDAIDKFQSGKIDHEALAKAHDALAAGHQEAAKEAQRVGDKKGSDLHTAAASAHLSAATAHRTADGEGYEPYVDKNGNEVKTEGMSYGELANLPTASDRLSANAADASKAADKHDVEMAKQENAQITSEARAVPIQPNRAAQTRDPNWNPRTSGALINMPKAGTQKGFNDIVKDYEKNIPVQLGLGKQAEAESKKAVADGDLETATAKMDEAVKQYEYAAAAARGIFAAHEKFQGQVKQANPADPKVAAFREQARSIRANEKAAAQSMATDLGKKFKEQEAAKISANRDAKKIVGE